MSDTVKAADRTWEVMCHLAAVTVLIGVPFGNILGPLVVWLLKRGDSPAVDAHGKESLNFQISVTLYLLAATWATVGLMLILVGFLLLPLLIAAFVIVPVADLVLLIVAAVQAGDGGFYRYPLTLRLIR